MHGRIATLTVSAWVLAVALLPSWWSSMPQAASAQTAPSRATAGRTLRLPELPYNYSSIDLPAHFSEPTARGFDNTPRDNPITDHGATLGRVLFYDTRLSANDTVSCGSCHVQAHAFVDPNRYSRGFEGRLTDRHAMSLVNLRYHPRGRFFWDERGGNLEAMVLLPVENPIEMGLDPDTLPGILAPDARYPDLFRRAFGDPQITKDRIARALAQFVRSMVSYQSKYDEGRAAARSAADDFSNFTLRENRGKALFLRNCSVCHLPGQEAHFVMVSTANSGLDDDPKSADGGVGDVTLNPREIGQFKSPSLRNVKFTTPYMHDGRFSTLAAVIDHYSSGGRNHPNRDVRMLPMHFTRSERDALVAFLETLTDTRFLTDPKFSDPFE